MGTVMKNIFKLVLVIILAGCSDTVKSVDYKFDPVKPADVKMSTCDKPDSELNLNDLE